MIRDIATPCEGREHSTEPTLATPGRILDATARTKARLALYDQRGNIVRELFELTSQLGIATELTLNELSARVGTDVHGPGNASSKQPPKCGPSKIDEERNVAAGPFAEQRATLCGDSANGPQRQAPIQRFEKLIRISLAPTTVQHPDQLAIKRIARSTFLGIEIGVLKLNHPTAASLYIRDVSFAVARGVNDLLPVSRELLLPGAMPARLILPPRIANAVPSMSPMVDADLAASGNHWCAAPNALA